MEIIFCLQIDELIVRGAYIFAGGFLSGSLRYWMCDIMALLNSAALLILTYFNVSDFTFAAKLRSSMTIHVLRSTNLEESTKSTEVRRR